MLSEEEIPAKVLRGDGRVCGTRGVHCRGGGVRGVGCRGGRGHGGRRRGSCVRGSFHIGQVAGHGEGAEVGRNEEDIDDVGSEVLVISMLMMLAMLARTRKTIL